MSVSSIYNGICNAYQTSGLSIVYGILDAFRACFTGIRHGNFKLSSSHVDTKKVEESNAEIFWNYVVYVRNVLQTTLQLIVDGYLYVGKELVVKGSAALSNGAVFIQEQTSCKCK